MIIIGLTGGIGSGKSTVGRLFRDRFGAALIDADQISRDVATPGTPAFKEIVEAFGTDILYPDGALNRAKLRERVFQDPEAKRTLEAITHPAIREGILKRIEGCLSEGYAVTLVEAALLVETGSYKNYPELIVVTCSREIQIRRIITRDQVTREAAERIVSTQLPTEQKAKVATIVIENNRELADLERSITDAWNQLAEKYPDSIRSKRE